MRQNYGSRSNRRCVSNAVTFVWCVIIYDLIICTQRWIVDQGNHITWQCLSYIIPNIRITTWYAHLAHAFWRKVTYEQGQVISSMTYACFAFFVNSQWYRVEFYLFARQGVLISHIMEELKTCKQNRIRFSYI